jgi:hypothetical protein
MLPQHDELGSTAFDLSQHSGDRFATDQMRVQATARGGSKIDNFVHRSFRGLARLIDAFLDGRLPYTVRAHSLDVRGVERMDYVAVSFRSERQRPIQKSARGSRRIVHGGKTRGVAFNSALTNEKNRTLRLRDDFERCTAEERCHRRIVFAARADYDEVRLHGRYCTSNDIAGAPHSRLAPHVKPESRLQKRELGFQGIVGMMGDISKVLSASRRGPAEEVPVGPRMHEVQQGVVLFGELAGPPYGETR